MPRIRLTIVLLTIASLVVAACSGAGDDAGSGGESDTLAAAALAPADVGSLDVSSPVFTENRPRKRIPKQNTCFGENMSPPLNWSGVPAGAKSLALIAEEPEDRISVMGSYTAVASGDAVHWLVYNIPVSLTGLAEGVPTSTSVLPDGTLQGTNDFDTIGYSGPCPPASVVVYGGITGAGRFSSDPPHDSRLLLQALRAGHPGRPRPGRYQGGAGRRTGRACARFRRNDGQVPEPTPAGLVPGRLADAHSQHAHSSTLTTALHEKQPTDPTTLGPFVVSKIPISSGSLSNHGPPPNVILSVAKNLGRCFHSNHPPTSTYPNISAIIHTGTDP